MFVKYGLRTLAVAIATCTVLAGTASAQSTLRICGDPENLPFSNQQLEGFENKIAAVIAADLGASPVYAWWPHQRGLIRNTIDAGTCEVIFGVPEGLDMVLWTKPYYRTSYVIAYRSDKNYRITSLDAPELKGLKLGLYANTPPEESLARRGLLNNLSLYSLFFDPTGTADRPLKLLSDLVSGVVDVAFPWGPQAGYYAKKFNTPLKLITLEDEPGVPLSFDISMGVKKGDVALKARLEAAIDRRQADIRTILEEYGVPLLPIPSHATQPAKQAEQSAGQTEPAKPAEQPTAQTEPAKQAEPQVADPAKKLVNPFTRNAEMIAEGKGLYIKVGCQGCHGGGGGGGMAVSLIDESWKWGSDDDTLYKLIKGQIPKQTMPAVYSVLPDDQVWKLLAFIRSLYIGDPSKVNW